MSATRELHWGSTIQCFQAYRILSIASQAGTKPSQGSCESEKDACCSPAGAETTCSGANQTAPPWLPIDYSISISPARIANVLTGAESRAFPITSSWRSELSRFGCAAYIHEDLRHNRLNCHRGLTPVTKRQSSSTTQTLRIIQPGGPHPVEDRMSIFWNTCFAPSVQVFSRSMTSCT